ncbi:MAG TPA: hypothetical protein VHZ51_14340 [Ktedonobacteraceae bacterium]|jgi:hypothetical protein|nr:hypothetical protein [Ktedonobacteraceae bacterium]
MMSTRLFSILSALCCILGAALLITSFTLNPAPSTNATGAQLAAFGKLYHNEILIGAWLQAISPFLILLFALAIVYLAGAITRFAGLVSICGGMLLVIVSLIEVTFFLGAANAGNLMTAQISLSLVRAVQHLYSIIAAPALIIPLGFVILGSRVLPRVLGYVAIVIGIVFAILGVIYLFTPVADGVAILAVTEAIEELWFPVAAITLIVRAVMTPATAIVEKPSPVSA